MKQYIDGKYIKTHTFTKRTLKQRIQDQQQRDTTKRLLKALAK